MAWAIFSTQEVQADRERPNLSAEFSIDMGGRQEKDTAAAWLSVFMFRAAAARLHIVSPTLSVAGRLS
jgi:hypothetical protein